MPEAQQRRLWRRQASAIRRLEPCINAASNASTDNSGKLQQRHCPGKQESWLQQHTRSFQPIHSDGGLHVKAEHQAEGRTAQAVLALPLACADVAVQLPPSLRLAATAAGRLDCRLQLLSVTAEWPVSRQPHTAGRGEQQLPRLLPAKSAAAGFACRCGALLLAHALFHENMHGVLGWLAVPVAVADGLAAVHAAVPEESRNAAAKQANKLKDRLQGRGSKQQGRRRHDGSNSSATGWAQPGNGIGWLDATGGVVSGTLHVLRCLSGPAAAIASTGWLWSVLHPPSHGLLSCMVALAAVAADYNQLGRDISTGRVGAGKEMEAAWHVRHKKAAQALAHYCGDLAPTPPLQPLLSMSGCCSIAAGLAVHGQGLTGLVAAACSQHSPCSTLGNDVQLVVSASVQPPAGGTGKHQQHKAAGLSRAQLLELFTGSTAGPAADAITDKTGCGSRHGVVAGANTADGSLSSCATNCTVISRKNSSGASSGVHSRGTSGSSSLDLVVDVRNSGSELEAVMHAEPICSCVPKEAAAAQAATIAYSAAPQQQQQQPEQQQQQAGTFAVHTLSRQPAAAAAAADPLAFLNDLPLYGQEDHAAGCSTPITGSEGLAAVAWHTQLLGWVELGLRASYLLLVFSPFLLLGVPMLLVAWWLLTRAAAAQQQQQQQHSSGIDSRVHGSLSTEQGIVAVVTPPPAGDNGAHILDGLSSLQSGVREAMADPLALLWRVLQQLLLLLSRLAALLDILLMLLLGGHWTAGVSAWEAAGLFLRKHAWQLLLFSSSAAGAAFIKWGQWSSSRRDIFPEDFCDTLAVLHDRAPVHSFRHTRRQVEAAFGKTLDELFTRFDPKPLASGSIAQVHRATLRRPAAAGSDLHGSDQQQQQQQGSSPDEVVVKVCHPNVYRHIKMDFRLLSSLSAAAARIPALRGLSLRESVAQFSHTMTAQTDLRVEAVHALRFYNNFSGVSSSVQIPRPIPGLVSKQVLVESYEPGRGVAVFMKQPSAINPQIVALGVDAFLKMLLVDNFVHTDLHPGNILFRAVPLKQQQQQQQQAHKGKEQQQQQQQQQLMHDRHRTRRRWWQLWRQKQSGSSMGANSEGPAACASTAAGAAQQPAQWEVELQEMISQQQQRWASRHTPEAAANASSDKEGGWLAKAASGTAADDAAIQQLELQMHGGGGSCSNGSSRSSEPALAAQLVLLDFGLAEQLTDEVRRHFISFLLAIPAGDGLLAARHLLNWSSHQTCSDTAAFKGDMVDLFSSCCDIHSEAGIDLDAVMKAVLGLARKHHLSIDSCYASLVISVCVLVGFATSLDPGVNIMDAATPALLAYSLTGKVLGRLYS